MATTRFGFLYGTLCAAALWAAGSVSAAPVVRADFGAPAVVSTTGFGLAPTGSLTVNPTGMTGTGGIVQNAVTNFGSNLLVGGVGLSGQFYGARERDNPNTVGLDLDYWGIRLSFSSAANSPQPVSAVGFDIVGNIGNRFVLSVYDSADTLLERLVRQWTDFTLFDSLDSDSPVIGFMGIDLGANNIAYATIASFVGASTTDRDGFALDNVVFESIPANQVPEPATALLACLGLAAAAAVRRRRKVV